MVDPAENDPKAKEAASKENASTESGETKNTPKTDDSLFHKGYGEGVAKGKKEFLSDLGTEDLDSVKEALKFKKEYEASQQTAEEKYSAANEELKALKKEVKGYRDKDEAEANTLFEALAEEHQTAVKATGLPYAQLVPMMRTLASTKKVEPTGSPFAPANADEQQESSTYQRRGLDPEYLKDKSAFIKKHQDEVRRRQSS